MTAPVQMTNTIRTITYQDQNTSATKSSTCKCHYYQCTLSTLSIWSTYWLLLLNRLWPGHFIASMSQTENTCSGYWNTFTRIAKLTSGAWVPRMSCAGVSFSKPFNMSEVHKVLQSTEHLTTLQKRIAHAENPTPHFTIQWTCLYVVCTSQMQSLRCRSTMQLLQYLPVMLWEAFESAPRWNVAPDALLKVLLSSRLSSQCFLLICCQGWHEQKCCIVIPVCWCMPQGFLSVLG